ncbi:MAG: hypothetical protein CM1200mP30_07650 [Pseudomonadota bacterium]|nr:MAG: hypothetical protein CM1200mP30_07650 [Pseudomonadota bacterium]
MKVRIIIIYQKISGKFNSFFFNDLSYEETLKSLEKKGQLVPLTPILF